MNKVLHQNSRAITMTTNTRYFNFVRVHRISSVQNGHDSILNLIEIF